jgi:hypothetical protein
LRGGTRSGPLRGRTPLGSPHKPTPRGSLGAEHGYTLIELLVAMSLGIMVSLAAFSFLEFATGDVSHITERVHVDQTGRVALEKIMLELHSACVTPSVAPIKAGSNATVIKFISEAGTESSLSSVRLHEIIYTAASGTKKGTLVEKTTVNTPAPSGGAAPNYTFPTTRTTSTLLVTGVKQSVSEKGETLPIFQYFRYYRASDPVPTGDTAVPYGQLDPTAIASSHMEENTEGKKEAENIAKVTIAFTLAPEGTEGAGFNHDRPVALEDSAVLRLAPSSESSGNPNLPCSPQT